MANFRRFLVPSLEDDTVVQDSENKDSIIDTAAVVDTILDPAVATPAPAADAPAEDAAADVNTPASTPEEPAATEAAPAEAATSEEVPSADAVTPPEPVDQPTAEPAVETPADTAPAAPAVEAPAADAATGATEDTTTAADTAADATQAPADTGEAVNAPESTEAGEGVVPAEPVVEPAATEPAAEVTETPVESVPAEPVIVPEAEVTPAEEPVATPAPEVTEPTDDELALEELEAELEADDSIRNETDILGEINDIQADDVVEQQLTAVLESLEVLQENVADLIDADECTDQTARMAEDTAQVALQQVGVSLEFPAMESYGGDVKIRHQLVLENLDNYADRIRQMLDVNFAERAKAILDQFKSYEGGVMRIKNNIKAVRAALTKKKPQLQETQHEGSLVGVSRFFNVKTENILPLINDDLKVSEYVLGKYPVEILKNLEQLNTVLAASTYKDPASFGKFLNKVADIEPQSKIFRMGKNHNVHALLGNYGIVHSVGSLPKTLNYGDQRFPELANSAKYDAYEEYRGTDLIEVLASTGHPVLVIGALVIGTAQAVAEIVTAQKVALTTDELFKLLDAAEGYADACLEWSNNISRIAGTYQKLDRSMEKFSRIGSEIEGISLGQRYRAWRLLGQVKAIIRNNLYYVNTPTFMESYRALLGARNCYYLAKRLVATAK